MAKRPRTSAVGNLSQCLSYSSEFLPQDDSTYFVSAWEELLSAQRSILCSSQDIQALQPGYNLCASIQPLPEDENIFHPDQIPEVGALEPGLESPTDIETVFDYDRGVNNDLSLSYSELPHVLHSPLLAHIDVASSTSDESRLPKESLLPSLSPLLKSDRSSSSYLSGSVVSRNNAHSSGNQSPVELPREAPLALVRVPRTKCPKCALTFVSHARAK